MSFDGKGMTRRKYIASITEEVGLKSTIEYFQNVLEVIWNNVFKMPKFESYLKQRIRTCPGIVSSIKTLQGINELCEIEDFPDAYLLIRKMRDNLFFDLFLFEMQKSFEQIPDASFKDIDLKDADEMMKALHKYNSLCIDLETNKNEFKAIDKWRSNKLLMSNNEDKSKREYFQFNKYISYLENNNEDFSECYKLFLEECFSKMNLKLNDYAHSNSESAMINKQKPIVVLCDIKDTLTNLEHLFLVSLFFVDSTLFSSDDYGDYIEENMVPPEGSQYWINGYIQEVMMDIKSKNNDLFRFMTGHNKYSMNIDVNIN